MLVKCNLLFITSITIPHKDSFIKHRNVKAKVTGFIFTLGEKVLINLKLGACNLNKAETLEGATTKENCKESTANFKPCLKLKFFDWNKHPSLLNR